MGNLVDNSTPGAAGRVLRMADKALATADPILGKHGQSRINLAEGVGFEPTVTQSATTAFEAAPFVRSGNLPKLSVVRLPEKYCFC